MCLASRAHSGQRGQSCTNKLFSFREKKILFIFWICLAPFAIGAVEAMGRNSRKKSPLLLGIGPSGVKVKKLPKFLARGGGRGSLDNVQIKVFFWDPFPKLHQRKVIF